MKKTKKFISKQICLPLGKFGSIKICVSGAAAGSCTIDAKVKAQAIGRAIADEGAILVTGATTGIPFESARGAKEVGGLSVGMSPAATLQEHVNKYRLPTENFDFIIYTGTGYAGRNLLLTRSSDAVIIVCGGITNEIPRILNTAQRGTGGIIYDTDPKRLIKKVVAAVMKKYKHNGLKPTRKKGTF